MSSIKDRLRIFDRLEDLSQNDSPLHKLHPTAKIAAVTLYIITVVSFPRYEVAALLPMFLYPAILMSISETPYSAIFKRVLAALPFALAAGIGNLIFDRDTAFQTAWLSVSFGVLSLISLMLKTLFTVMSVLILVASTPTQALIKALLALHVPQSFCLQLMLTRRYISVLADEVTSRSRAYALRSPGSGRVKFKDMGLFLAQLLLRSFDKADNVCCAMKCRGFDGSYSAEKLPPASKADYLFLAASVPLIIVPRFVSLGRIINRMFS